MFFDIYSQLCKRKNISPSKAAADMNINKSTVTYWKTSGVMPNGTTLNKISDYFDISIDELLGNEKKPLIGEDEELNELMESLKNRPGMRTLFSKTKNATKEDIEKVIKMLDIMKGTDYDD